MKIIAIELIVIKFLLTMKIIIEIIIFFNYCYYHLAEPHQSIIH